MPWFYFDLMIYEHPRDRGGMILENAPAAKERADALAQELRIARPELQGRGCYICVVDDEGIEVHRTFIDPIPSWSISTGQK